MKLSDWQKHFGYEVRKAYTLTHGGREVQDGWDLLHNDEWCQRFRTKRDADHAAFAVITQKQRKEPSDADYLAALEELSRVGLVPAYNDKEKEVRDYVAKVANAALAKVDAQQTLTCKVQK